MAWSKTQDNSRRASTGASMSSFVRRTGSSRTMFSRSEALVKSRKSSASPTLRFFSGCESTASSAAQFQRPETSSIGDCLVRITRCGTDWANSTRDGSVELPPSAKRFMQAKNGNRHAVRFGCATRRHASGAGWYMPMTPASRFTSITSHPSRSRNCGQRYRTFCLSASPVTNGFTQEGM